MALKTPTLMPEETPPVVTHPDRLAILKRTGLLDSPPEEAFDRMTKLAGKILRAPVALVSLVDRERQFFKSELGLPEPWAERRETPLSHSFCKHVVRSNKPLIVADARKHPLVGDNLAVSEIGVVAYAGVPLTTSTGHALGSFCAIDTQPREWTKEEIAILTDLAAFTMTEIELRLAARQLQENYRQLEKLSSLRDNLTQMIVHDLRTPLSAMLMGFEMMPFLGDLNEEQQNCLGVTLKGGQTLQRMINDLLDISKMESGEIQLEKKEITLSHLAETALNQVDLWAKTKDIILTAEINLNSPTLAADERMLQRILVNLLTNAIKFTPSAGSVTLLLDDRNRKTDELESVQFAVRDNGEGIPEDELDRIFEKFKQVEKKDSRQERGTGLGLTFCKLAVEAHGGRIWVDSKPGQGSTFSFNVPRQQTELSTNPPQ